MSIQRSASPLRVIEAQTGVHLAQAAGLWLRASRQGEPWLAGHADRVLLAFAGDTPVAVAQVQRTQFGNLAIDRFRAAHDADAGRLREHLADYIRVAASGGPLRAVAA